MPDNTTFAAHTTKNKVFLYIFKIRESYQDNISICCLKNSNWSNPKIPYINRNLSNESNAIYISKRRPNDDVQYIESKHSSNTENRKPKRKWWWLK